MSIAISYAVYLLVPIAVVILTLKHSLAEKIGAIVLCYLAGLTLGMSGMMPEAANVPRETLSEVSLGLALPLLLFSVDVRGWGRVAGKAMLSMLFAIIAIVTVSTTLFYMFTARGVPEAEQLTGMAVGMYTGGVANLAAIKHALVIPDDRFLVFVAIDTIVGALYLLFVLTLAPRIFKGFLPDFNSGLTTAEAAHAPSEPTILGAAAWKPISLALAVAGVCVGFALALAPHFSVVDQAIATIVLLTSFALVASFIPALRNNLYAPKIGMFLIYVFSFCVASSLDLSQLAGMDLSIWYFVILATIGGITLHAALCWIFKIDRDTFLITSVAALLSPAFVPMVARNLNNPAILMSGMATGILGFAIGNYLGISVAQLLAN